jgi:hypothetical protein
MTYTAFNNFCKVFLNWSRTLCTKNSAVEKGTEDYCPLFHAARSDATLMPRMHTAGPG